ncbi:endothelin-3 [Rhinatrema bivittatum]|uniref:endothelin-3 n=1 Tax=Rhinatrema bivittatum TaxID=194408 RepID=UPI00112DFC0B|nr:endothelin-3 [Rhinatrema bivittatum]
MELQFLLLLGLTITSNAGFSLAVSLAQASAGGRLIAQPRDGARKGGREEREPGAPLPGPEGEQPHRRAKRCTCKTYKDKECVYYCHLDVIWINTPERTVPYGLSNHRGNRGKRAVADLSRSPQTGRLLRCFCVDRNDKQCSSFCRRNQDSRSKKDSQEGRQKNSKTEQINTVPSKSIRITGLL